MGLADKVTLEPIFRVHIPELQCQVVEQSAQVAVSLDRVVSRLLEMLNSYLCHRIRPLGNFKFSPVLWLTVDSSVLPESPALEPGAFKEGIPDLLMSLWGPLLPLSKSQIGVAKSEAGRKDCEDCSESVVHVFSHCLSVCCML